MLTGSSSFSYRTYKLAAEVSAIVVEKAEDTRYTVILYKDEVNF